MHFPYFVAKRYLLGKKSRNAINYITAISIAVTALVSMALIVILSVFNGLSSLISSLYGSFDPQIKIETTKGKFFDPTELLSLLKKHSDYIHYSEVIEEDVLLKYNKKQFIGRIKGVDKNFSAVTGIDSSVVQGDVNFAKGHKPNIIVGQGLAYYLSIGLNFLTPVHIYAPNPKAKANTAPDKAFKHKSVFPSAIFAVQQEVDSKYLITDIELATEILGLKNKVSSIEIGFRTGISPKEQSEITLALKEGIPENFSVKSIEEQHEFLYKALKSEKWMIFLIISFILVIASFNIVGSLSMLIIDKKKDINILKSMGASIKLIKKIFIIEGWLITGSGIVLGIASGTLICLAQQKFGLLKLQGEGNFLISAYPVEIQFNDIIIVTLTVSLIGLSAAFYPVSRISQKFIN